MTAPTVERPTPDTLPALGAVVEILEQPWDGNPIPDTSFVCPGIIRINGRALYSNTADPVIVERITPLILAGRPIGAVGLTLNALAFWTPVDDSNNLPEPPDFDGGTVFEFLQDHENAPPGYRGHSTGRRALGERIHADYPVRLIGDGHEPLPIHVSSDDPVTVVYGPIYKPTTGRWPIRVTLTLLVRRLVIGDTTD